MTRDDANAVIARWHSHHRPVKGHRFAIGAYCEGEVVGTVIVGNPKARLLNDGVTFEVTRLCTNGHKNAASRLLGAAWRAARAMGVTRMVSYLRADDTGVCYRAAGWTQRAAVPGRQWDAHSDRRRVQEWLPELFTPTTETIDRCRWEVAS